MTPLPGAAVVFTDGACLGNPGPGGWAWAEPDGAYASGAAARTTNQRMEITAAYEAVKAHPGPLEVVSDSTYVVNCFRDRWWEGWIAPGLDELGPQARGQPRPVGAVRRAGARPGRRDVPLGQGPLGRPA